MAGPRSPAVHLRSAPRCHEDADQPRRRRDLRGRRVKINTVNVGGKSRNFARRGVRTSGKQCGLEKSHRHHRAGPKDRARRRQLLRAITMAVKEISSRPAPGAASSRPPISADSRKKTPRSRCSRSRRSTRAATTTATSPRAIKGGGTRKQYRIIDFKRAKDGIPAKVAAIEYDPNRTARIALLHYRDGEKRYILAPVGPQGRRRRRVRSERRHQDRQRAAAPRTFRSARSSTTSSCGPARAASSCARPASSAQLMAKGRRVRAGAHAVGRSAQDPHRLPRDDRSARQPRARERSRSARPAVSATSASARRFAASR